MFLVRVVGKESRHLQQTDSRVFAAGLSQQAVENLEDNIQLAEQIEAFVSRLGRLQDTLGDKLLPATLLALGEKPGAVIDNLDRAERLGFIESVDEWLSIRKLRNQMVHDYVEDPVIFYNALHGGHRAVAVLVAVATRLQTEIEQRNWL